MTTEQKPAKPELVAVLDFDYNRNNRSHYDAASVKVYFQEVRTEKELIFPYSHERGLAHIEQTASIDIDDAKNPDRPLDWRADRLKTTLYHPDLAEMEECVTLLKSINRKLDAISAKYGSPANFGQYLMRLCSALGIKRYTRIDTRYNDWYEFHAIGRLDSELANEAYKCRPAKVEPANVESSAA